MATATIRTVMATEKAGMVVLTTLMAISITMTVMAKETVMVILMANCLD